MAEKSGGLRMRGVLNCMFLSLGTFGVLSKMSLLAVVIS
jgi:hypothetical protein